MKAVQLKSALLVSDVHLTDTSPSTAGLFFNYLREHAPKYQGLVILGDLFEAWPGDDVLAEAESCVTHLITLLTELQEAGVLLYFMPGNRDFLLGDGFAERSGVRLTRLFDPCIAAIAGQAILLAHGDAYCTDDAPYQELRKQLRSAEWQASTLAKPLEERLALANKLREESEQAKQGKSMQIMDVNPTAILKAFNDHGVNTMIHGHTHRPGLSSHEGNKRYVLPDWHAPATTQEARRGGGIGVSPHRGVVVVPA